MKLENRMEFNRRWFVGYLSSVGLGSTLLPGTLTAVAQDSPKITAEMVEAAARLAGISLERPAIDKIVGSFNSRMSLLPRYEAIRGMKLGNSVPSALVTA